MANIKIAQLTNATTISDSDIVLIEDATQTKKMTVANLKSLLGINGGGVVESGSNANGSYVKFGDGTMICWHQKSTVNDINTPEGALFTTGSNPWSYPSTFNRTPNVFFNEVSGVGGSWGALGGGATTQYDTTFQVLRTTGYPAKPTAGLMAIGRWKA